MFFPRLRRRAKPVFLLLAIVFGLGFVALGVGTGVSGTSVGDILSDVFRSGGSTSIGDAEKKVEASPNDAEALLELANAYQAAQRNAEAIAALERYRGLAPEEVDALKQLAGLYAVQATREQERALQVQAEASTKLFGRQFGPPADTPLGQALASDPIADAIRQEAGDRLSAAGEAIRLAYRKVAGAYEALTLLEPDEPSNFFQLGFAAQQAGDTESAIAAYERFLELSPDDSQAPYAKAQLEALEAPTPTVSAG